MNYRNRKLLDLAHKVENCQACGKTTPDGCEPAHANGLWYGKGTSIKSHDCYHAALCHECHASYDQGGADRSQKMAVWRDAFEKTILLYWERGWLQVK